jgi:hypothetical protein
MAVKENGHTNKQHYTKTRKREMLELGRKGDNVEF